MQRFSFMEHLGCAEPRPQFPCDHTDCEHAEWEKDYLTLCEGCQGRFCKEHVKKIGDLYACEKCCVCERMAGPVKCGDPALFVCDNCGNFLCAGDARARTVVDQETGYVDASIVCRGGCGNAIEVGPKEVVALQEEESCPF